MSKENRKPIAEVRAENRQLREACLDLQWMARRYADGRGSYAVGVVNAITRYFVSIGMPILKDPIAKTMFARDAMGRNFDRLAPHEVGENDPSKREIIVPGEVTADDIAAKIRAQSVTELERAHRIAHAEGDLRMRR